MRTFSLLAGLAAVAFSALPAAAQSATTAAIDGSWPSAVYWVGGIAAFLGFFLGSINAHSEFAADEWDMGGSLVWAMAAAGFFGGATLFFTTGVWFPACIGVGLGAILGIMRLIATRPPRVPQNMDLQPGINRAQGDTAKRKLKSATSMFNGASFHDGNYYATRAPREWWFGKEGMPKDVLSVLSGSLARPHRDQFDILLLLVRDLPGEAGEPGVIVVRSGENLKQVKPTEDGLDIPNVGKVACSSVIASVGYAWR